MGKNKKNIDDILEKLTIVTEAANDIFPKGKTILVYELNDEDFKEIQGNFRQIDNSRFRFKIDISDSEIVFINNKIYDKNEDIKEDIKEEKVSFWKKLFSLKRSKPSI
jgi:hypothetical protein